MRLLRTPFYGDCNGIDLPCAGVAPGPRTSDLMRDSAPADAAAGFCYAHRGSPTTPGTVTAGLPNGIPAYFTGSPPGLSRGDWDRATVAVTLAAALPDAAQQRRLVFAQEVDSEKVESGNRGGKVGAHDGEAQIVEGREPTQLA